MKIKFTMSWGSPAYPTEWNAIPISNIPNGANQYISFFYETLASKGFPDRDGRADIKYINYDLGRAGVVWDVDPKEINRAIIKIFTKLDEL